MQGSTLRRKEIGMSATIGRVYSTRRRVEGRCEETALWCSRMGCVATFAFSILVAPLAAMAQQPAAVPRIGVLWPVSAALLEPFRQGLRELGYVEGQNLLIEYRWAEGQVERLPDLAAELVRLPVAVMVTAGEAATRAARQASRTIPIVVAITGDLNHP